MYFCQIQRLQKTSFQTSCSPDHAGRDITSRCSQRDLSLAISKGVLVRCLCPWMPIFQSLCFLLRRWGGSGLLLGRGLHPPASSATVSFWRANLSLLFVMDAKIQQPLVINGHNTHTPDSRKACQAIAFLRQPYSSKVTACKIKPSSVA